MVPGGRQREVKKLSRGNLSNVGVEVDQGLQRRPETGGKMVSGDREEEVFSSLKVEDEDVIQ